MLKSSNDKNNLFFVHICFQEIGRGDIWIGVMTDFDTKTNFIQQGKHKAFHLTHETKIIHMEVVDPGKIRSLSYSDVILRCSY